MDDSLQELKNVLQTLALPVIGQVHMFKNGCTRVDELAGASNVIHRSLRNEGDKRLTPRQAGTLARLDERLAQVRRQSPSLVYSELSMRKSAEWRQVRVLAREALIRFSWPLDVPPHEVLQSNRWLN